MTTLIDDYADLELEIRAAPSRNTYGTATGSRRPRRVRGGFVSGTRVVTTPTGEEIVAVGSFRLPAGDPIGYDDRIVRIDDPNRHEYRVVAVEDPRSLDGPEFVRARVV